MHLHYSVIVPGEVPPVFTRLLRPVNAGVIEEANDRSSRVVFGSRHACIADIERGHPVEVQSVSPLCFDERKVLAAQCDAMMLRDGRATELAFALARTVTERLGEPWTELPRKLPDCRKP